MSFFTTIGGAQTIIGTMTTKGTTTTVVGTKQTRVVVTKTGALSIIGVTKPSHDNMIEDPKTFGNGRNNWMTIEGDL